MLWIEKFEMERKIIFQKGFLMVFINLFWIQVKKLSFSFQTLRHPLIEKWLKISSQNMERFLGFVN